MSKTPAPASEPTKISRGRGRPKLSEHEAEKFRSRISYVARVLFIEEGYGGVSIRKIAKNVPCSVGVLYNHFENKRDILQEIWDDIFLVSFKYCHTAANKQSHTIDKLRDFCNAYVHYWITHPDHFKMIYLLNKQEKENEDYASHSFSYLKYEWVTGLIVNALKDGELTPKNGITAHEIAESLYSICQGLAYRNIFYEGNIDKEDRIPEIAIDALLNGFFTR